MRGRALHGAGLYYAIVFPGCLHHLHAFIHHDTDGLFDINILAGLAGFHRHISVPMIGRRNTDHVDGFVGQHLAEIAIRFGLILAVAHGPIEIPLVHIAHRDWNHVLLLHREMQVGTAHLAHADEGGRDLVVRSSNLTCEQRSG